MVLNLNYVVFMPLPGCESVFCGIEFFSMAEGPEGCESFFQDEIEALKIAVLVLDSEPIPAKLILRGRDKNVISFHRTI